MFELTVEKEFAAAHRLIEYTGNCERLHGHNWKVELTLKTDKLDDCGLAVDFREARQVLAEALSVFDHTYLNDLEMFSSRNPTCERIAEHVFHAVQSLLSRFSDRLCLRVSKVTVWESPGSSVTYRESDG